MLFLRPRNGSILSSTSGRRKLVFYLPLIFWSNFKGAKRFFTPIVKIRPHACQLTSAPSLSIIHNLNFSIFNCNTGNVIIHPSTVSRLFSFGDKLQLWNRGIISKLWLRNFGVSFFFHSFFHNFTLLFCINIKFQYHMLLQCISLESLNYQMPFHNLHS